MSGKGKRLSETQRLDIISKLSQPNHPSKRSIARQYEVTEAAIRKIWTKRKAIHQRSALMSEETKKKRFRACIGKFTEVDSKLYLWIDVMRRANLPVTPSLAILKAKEIAQQLNISQDDFKASRQWFNRFRARHGLQQNLLQHETPNQAKSSTANTEPSHPTKSLIPPVDPNTLDCPTEFEKHVQRTYGRYPLTITHGKGCKLYSQDDEYLDFVSGIATCALGHGNQDLIQAVSKQMESLHHISNLYYIPQQAALAKWLCENSVADKAFFCNSGAEANEGAIKLARRHASNRGITDPIIITAIDSFHGRTLAALTATAQPKYHKGFGYGGDMVQGFQYVPYNDPEALEEMVNEMNRTPPDLESKGRKRGVAAIMLEPLQGEGGIVPGKAEYFQKARELCDDSNALLLLDEVQAGMGRTGTLWGYENLNVIPDVFTSAKALGGGVPIGAMMARGEAANVFGPGDHASTYGGNPLACASGLAVAKYFSEHNILNNVNARGEQLEKGLQALAEKYPKILGGTRGMGLLRGIEVREESGITPGALVGDAMKEGLLLVPAGSTVVRFVPPLIVTASEVDNALELFEKALIKKTVTHDS